MDVLKVAHHGSAYQDPDLIRRVAPRLALISCGVDNPYGHPAPSTVAALRASGAEVLRTDEDGAVAVAGGGGGLLVAETEGMKPVQADAYLRRISADRPARPTDDALRELQLRHLRTVPFENLSIHLGEEIVLEEKRLLNKVVGARRGGFCTN